jgi:Ca2+-binding EF-hand superfamily protein
MDEAVLRAAGCSPEDFLALPAWKQAAFKKLAADDNYCAPWASRQMAAEPAEAPHPAVTKPWALKEEATRIFRLADLDGNGVLDLSELANTLKKPQFAATALKNFDENSDGVVSLEEWLVATKKTFDLSEAACRTSLRASEKAIMEALASKLSLTEEGEEDGHEEDDHMLAWALQREATRIFRLADLDGNGVLDLRELSTTLVAPSELNGPRTERRQHELVRELMSIAVEKGVVSLEEWLSATRRLFDLSEAACRTSLRASEKAIRDAKISLSSAAAHPPTLCKYCGTDNIQSDHQGLRHYCNDCQNFQD